MTVQTDIDALLTVLKSDVITVLSGPLQTLLAALEPVNGVLPSALTVEGAWVVFHGALIMALPKLGGLSLGQVISSLQARLTALAAANPPAAAA